MGEVAEEISADAGELPGVEAAFDELSGVFAASGAFVPLCAAFVDNGGQVIGSEWVDGPAGVRIEDFAEAAELAADDGQAAGHGFGDDIGYAVAIAVWSDDTGHAEAAGLLDMDADLIRRQDAGPGDKAVDIEVFRLSVQVFCERPPADNGQADAIVLLFEQADGVEKDGDTFFGDKPPDEEQLSWAGGVLVGLEGPFVKKDTMIEDIEAVLVGRAVVSECLRGGLIAHSDEDGRFEEPLARIFTGVNIKGVDTDAVADTEVLGDIGGEECGQVSEFGMDMPDVFVAAFSEEAFAQFAVADDGQLGVDAIRQDVGDELAYTRRAVVTVAWGVVVKDGDLWPVGAAFTIAGKESDGVDGQFFCLEKQQVLAQESLTPARVGGEQIEDGPAG